MFHFLVLCLPFLSWINIISLYQDEKADDEAEDTDADEKVDAEADTDADDDNDDAHVNLLLYYIL